jgi:hypothetical protein
VTYLHSFALRRFTLNYSRACHPSLMSAFTNSTLSITFHYSYTYILYFDSWYLSVAEQHIVSSTL